MRIDEIASAEDQIALFKLITDKVWQSLAELERADAEAKAQQPLKAKLTAKTNARASATKRTASTKSKPSLQQRPSPQTPQLKPHQAASTLQSPPELTKQLNVSTPPIGSKYPSTEIDKVIN
jgi:hypothetical protein